MGGLPVGFWNERLQLSDQRDKGRGREHRAFIRVLPDRRRQLVRFGDFGQMTYPTSPCFALGRAVFFWIIQIS